MAIGSIAAMGSSIMPAVSGTATSVMGALGGNGGMGGGLLSMGGSLLGTLTGFLGDRSEAKALKKQQEEQWKQQMINVREQYRQLGAAEQQANQEAGEQLIDNQVSLLQQKSQVELMAAATGTGGASISSMLTDLTGQAGRNQSKIIRNFENQQQGFINQAKAIRTGGQMVQRQIKKPSAFAAVAQGLSALPGAFDSGRKTSMSLKKAWDDSRSYSSGLGGK